MEQTIGQENPVFIWFMQTEYKKIKHLKVKMAWEIVSVTTL